MNMIGSVKLFGSKDGVADHTEIFFYDDTDQPVPPDEASRILIRESRKDGTVLKETWAFCQYDHKETA